MKTLSPALFLLTAALILVLGGWWMASSGPHESEATPRKQSLEEPVAERTAALESVTASDGRAQVAPPSAVAPTRASADEELEVAPPAAASPTLSGTVVDEEGFTVAGAEVRIWEGGRVSGDPVRTVTSSPDGTFSAPGVGHRFVAAAFHPDKVCVRGLRGILGADTECVDLELVLGPAHDFTGLVVDPGGLPVTGAVLELGDDLLTSSSLDSTETPGVTTFGSIAGALATRQVTGPDGRFRFPGVEGNGVAVRVEAEGFVGQWANHPPSSGPATITLDRGHRLEALVLDADGQPAAGAEIRFGPVASNLGLVRTSAKADAAGRFSFSGIADAEDQWDKPAFIAALHRGHAVTLLQPAALDDGGQRNVIRLERSAPLGGRVVNAAGEPVSGVGIWLRSEREYERSYVTVGTPPTWESLFPEFRRSTGADGRFEFPHRFKGPCSLKVQGPSEPRRTIIVEVGADESEVEVRLDDEALRGVALEGRLLDAATRETIEAFRLLPWTETEDGARLAQGDDHRSGADGRFRVEGLGEATWELEFEAEGYANELLAPRAFEKGVHDLGEVTMTPAVRLRVEVLDPAGDPWPDGFLRLEDGAGKPVRVTIGSLGTTGANLHGEPVLIEGVPASPLTLVVESQGVRWEEEGVQPGAHVGQTLTLVVPRPEVGSLQVSFLDRAALGPDADAFLAGFRQAMTDRDQSWMVKNRERILAAFPKETLEVQVTKGGEGIGSGEVRWLTDSETYRTSTSSGNGGSSSEGAPFPDLRWSGLPVGDYSVTVTRESGAATTVSVKVGKRGESQPPVVIGL